MAPTTSPMMEGPMRMIGPHSELMGLPFRHPLPAAPIPNPHPAAISPRKARNLMPPLVPRHMKPPPTNPAKPVRKFRTLHQNSKPPDNLNRHPRHTRLGAPVTITQSGIGTETRAYHPGTGAPESVTYPTAHTLLPGKSIAWPEPDPFGRPLGLTPSHGPHHRRNPAIRRWPRQPAK